MNFLRFAFFVFAIGIQLSGADSIGALVRALHSEDYSARLSAKNSLESTIARASSPKVTAAQRLALEKELLGHLSASQVPELSCAYLIRLLPPIASEPSVQLMFRMVLDEKTSPLLGSEAAGLLAILGRSIAPDIWLQHLLKASEPSRELLWTAIALNADNRLAKPLVKLLRKKKISLNNGVIQTLGAMGGREAASFLFTEWKASEATRRSVLAKAILHTAAAKASELAALCKGSDSTEIRVAALRQWAVQEEEASLAFLQAQLQKDAVDGKALMAAQLGAGSKLSWKWLNGSGATFKEAITITVLQQICEQKRKDMEPWVLGRLEGGSEAVELAVLRCLSVVGGKRSTEVILAKMGSWPQKVVSEAMNTLAVVEDSSFDSRLKDLLLEPRHPQYLWALDVFSLRNSEGSTLVMNELFAQRSPRGEALTVGLRGLERLGDITSVKLLLARIQEETAPETIRALRITLKRLVTRLEQPSRIWKEAFSPALSQAKDAEAQARVLGLLDAVADPAALALCVERLRGKEPVLASAAEQAILRWRNIEVCDYWFSVFMGQGESDAARAKALEQIELVLRSDEHANQSKKVIGKAAELFLASESQDLRNKMLSVVGGLSKRWKKEFYALVKTKAKSAPGDLQQLETWLGQEAKEIE